MNFTSAPAFSVPQTERKVFEGETESPGPAYNTYGLGKRHSSFSHGIGKSSRYQINHGQAETPAPGQYNPQKISLNTNKKITIPKSSYETKDLKQVPDPGFYQPTYQQASKKILTYSVGQKYPSIMDDVKKTPGPGAYETIPDISKGKYYENDLAKLKKSSSTFNTSSARFGSLKKLQPGPGDYDLLVTDKILSPDNKGKFGTDSKHKPIKQITPGPSQYKKLSKFEQALHYKMGKSMGIKPKKSSFIPQVDITSNAFGKYQTGASYRNVKQAIAAYSIGKSPRKIWEDNKVPGPLDYVKQNYQNKNTFRATIPTTGRYDDDYMNDNPGPGTYQLLQKKASTYTIPRSQSTKLFSTLPNPGVGRYDVQKITSIEKGEKGCKFQNSKRTNFISKNLAGVGDYEIQNKKKDAITMPKSQRFQKNLTNKPGPGDYHIPSTIGKYNNYSSSKRIVKI